MMTDFDCLIKKESYLNLFDELSSRFYKGKFLESLKEFYLEKEFPELPSSNLRMEIKKDLPIGHSKDDLLNILSRVKYSTENKIVKNIKEDNNDAQTTEYEYQKRLFFDFTFIDDLNDEIMRENLIEIKNELFDKMFPIFQEKQELWKVKNEKKEKSRELMSDQILGLEKIELNKVEERLVSEFKAAVAYNNELAESDINHFSKLIKQNDTFTDDKLKDIAITQLKTMRKIKLIAETPEMIQTMEEGYYYIRDRILREFDEKKDEYRKDIEELLKIEIEELNKEKIYQKNELNDKELSELYKEEDIILKNLFEENEKLLLWNKANDIDSQELKFLQTEFDNLAEERNHIISQIMHLEQVNETLFVIPSLPCGFECNCWENFQENIEIFSITDCQLKLFVNGFSPQCIITQGLTDFMKGDEVQWKFSEIISKDYLMTNNFLAQYFLDVIEKGFEVKEDDIETLSGILKEIEKMGCFFYFGEFFPKMENILSFLKNYQGDENIKNDINKFIYCWENYKRFIELSIKKENINLIDMSFRINKLKENVDLYANQINEIKQQIASLKFEHNSIKKKSKFTNIF